MKNKTIYLISTILAIISIILIFLISKNSAPELGLFVVLILRILIPLTIPRFPLWGIIASLIIDAVDVVIADILGVRLYSHYHSADKILDTYYLAIAFLVSFNWEKIPKYTSIGLFIYRIIGVVAFEITGQRIYLFIFQNLFENFFIFEAARQKYFNQWKWNKKRLIVVLLLLEIPKMIQEYILHYAEANPWIWIKTNILN